MIGLTRTLQAAERFAIDWIKIDWTGRAFTGDKRTPENWVGYGAKVYVVVGGS